MQVKSGQQLTSHFYRTNMSMVVAIGKYKRRRFIAVFESFVCNRGIAIPRYMFTLSSQLICDSYHVASVGEHLSG
jgi:hypothetical protein